MRLQHTCFLPTVILLAQISAFAGDSLRYYLPEQTITATRSERNWLETPTAFTVLKKESQPADRGMGVTESLMLVPGLVASSRFGTDDMRLSVRGMGARSNTGVRGVRVLYDGIPESEPDGQARLEGIDPGTVDRAEVLRGGGSALYGNASGGVVNLMTAETFRVPGVQAGFIGSGYGYRKVSVTAGTRPARSDSAIHVRLDLEHLEFEAGPAAGEGGTITLSRTVSDGWREQSRHEAYNVSGAWTVYGDAKSSLRTLFYFVYDNSELPGTLRPEQFQDDPFQADSSYQALDIRRITRKGRLGLRYTKRISSSLSFEFTPYAVLKKFDRPRVQGPDYRLITRYLLGGTLQGEWSGLVAGRSLQVVVGVDEQFQDGPISTYYNDAGSRSDSLVKEERKSQWGQGVFAECSMDISDRVAASAGLRYDDVRFVEETLTNGERYTNDEEAVTPRFGLRYHVVPGIVLFGAVYGGFETPSRKETENTAGFDVKPQRTLTEELGIRGQRIVDLFQLQWEATVYHMTVTDIIIPDILAGEELFTNAGEAVHEGVELSASVSRPRLGFLGVAASFGQFRFTDYVTAFGNFNDKKLPGVSPDLVSAVIRWTPHDLFFTECTARASGSAYANTENLVSADGWTVLGATIGGELPVDFLSGSWYVGVQNLTDERYVSFIQVNDSEDRYFEMGMPRTVVAGLRIGTPGL